ncbi:ABC transporter C-terminal domain-containing protein [Ktedonospora formicarum]|uniref:ABC transporter Uup C-terminal domain-containing protein n=1 Tax=Ktedonospora formicarum TaxID=2778364 RepID=A0A8J3HRZ2_9CHLR|nr:ABC transporter C-terminal domain-containing protein [Ktedonospora formicarum]GHO42842.1 hypothetical protein KSX_10050 [Ktedonospora formicarum]
MEKAEARIKDLEEELSLAALEANAERLTELNEAYEQAKTRVEELLMEWEQLADVAS